MTLEVSQLKLENGVALGMRIKIPGNYLLIINANKGFMMCGIMDIKVAQKGNLPAVRITNVKNFTDMLNQKIESFTNAAKKLGVIAGMTGKEALQMMM
jgi:uncharacterized protein YunC (DUF1805 family)